MIGNGIANPDGMNATDDGDARKASDFCKDYVRGNCTRDNCRFLHEVPPKGFLKELFRFCHDFQNKGCFRSNCKFIHCSVEDEERFYATGIIPRDPRNPLCQAYIQGNCINNDCKLVHPPDVVGNDLIPMMNLPPLMFTRPPPPIRDEDSPPEPKFRRYTFDESALDKQVMPCTSTCNNCEALDHKIKLLHDNISVLLKKVADLTEKNMQLTSMNEFLLGQTASIRSDHPCVITSRHGSSAPVSLATVSVTPVVSLAGALPTLVPATATSNLALAPAASRAQLLTPAPQILTVSTTQQLVGNSGALIVTSAGAQQLMQVSDSGTLMGGGQTVVAVTPAQLTLAPPAQQLISSAPQTAVQQLVQQSALQSQLAPQHQAPQYAAAQHNTTVQHLAAAQQSAQHLAAQQSAQHLAAQQSAQQSAQHLAAQQSAQHLAAQQSAQHLAQQSAQQLAAVAQQSAQQMAVQQSAQQQLVPSAQQLVHHAQHMVAQQSAQQLAAQQSAQQQLVPSAQQLVHQTSTQQITISSQAQPMALPNSQAQSITFPIISQSILPH